MRVIDTAPLRFKGRSRRLLAAFLVHGAVVAQDSVLQAPPVDGLLEALAAFCDHDRVVDLVVVAQDGVTVFRNDPLCLLAGLVLVQKLIVFCHSDPFHRNRFLAPAMVAQLGIR